MLHFAPEIVAETTEKERTEMLKWFVAENRKWVNELTQTLTEFAKCPEEYDIQGLAKQILGMDEDDLQF